MKIKLLNIILIATSLTGILTVIYLSNNISSNDIYDTEIIIVQPNSYLSASQNSGHKHGSRYRSSSSQKEFIHSNSTNFLEASPYNLNESSILRDKSDLNNSGNPGVNNYKKQESAIQESGSFTLSSASNLYSSKQNRSSENTAFQQSAAMNINNAYAAKISPFSTPIGVDPDNPEDEDMGNPLPVSGGIWILIGLALIHSTYKNILSKKTITFSINKLGKQ